MRHCNERGCAWGGGEKITHRHGEVRGGKKLLKIIFIIILTFLGEKWTKKLCFVNKKLKICWIVNKKLFFKF